MNYESYFAQALAQLREERRYRVFADLERHRRPLSARNLALPAWSARRHRVVLQ